MKIKEAKNTTCPIAGVINVGTGVKWANCKADDCNWWLEAEPDEGECAIMTIAKGLTTPLVITLPQKDLEIIR